MSHKPNIIKDKTYQFALKIIYLYMEMRKQNEFIVSKQVVRSGTSIGANACPVKQLEVIMHYTYVLQSAKDMIFYVGLTKDLKLRFEQHNKGLVESTKGRMPFNLIYYEAGIDSSDAVQRDKYLKTYHGRMFLKRRLKSYLTG
jgi:putative endonuclease